MNDSCIYLIQLHGQVDETELNSMSPLQMTLEQGDPSSTCFRICTDQSGLIGLMRHLHGLGFVFLSLNRVDIAEKAAGRPDVNPPGQPEFKEEG
jgi:hypothetical protein